MARKLAFTVRLSLGETMARLRGVVRRQSTFWFSGRGCANPKPLMGHLGERSFRLFAGKRHSRAMPLFLTGDVTLCAEGCRVSARIGLRIWDIACCAFCVAVLTGTTAAGSWLILASDGPTTQKLAGALGVALLWALSMGALVTDRVRNLGDGPLLEQSLRQVFGDAVIDGGELPATAATAGSTAPD
jgi:hypothetical protein